MNKIVFKQTETGIKAKVKLKVSAIEAFTFIDIMEAVIKNLKEDMGESCEEVLRLIEMQKDKGILDE